MVWRQHAVQAVLTCHTVLSNMLFNIIIRALSLLQLKHTEHGHWTSTLSGSSHQQLHDAMLATKHEKRYEESKLFRPGIIRALLQTIDTFSMYAHD